MKGSGQVAGAAALAVAGAGKALMPVFDRLATSLISENPVLLEDLRCVRSGGGQARGVAVVMISARQHHAVIHVIAEGKHWQGTWCKVLPPALLCLQPAGCCVWLVYSPGNALYSSHDANLTQLLLG